MTGDKVERLILERAVEDFTGLWELVWDLCGRGKVETEAISNLGAAVKNLLDRKWVSVIRGHTFDGDQVTLSRDEVDRALANNDSWREPAPREEQLRIAATPDGERAYFGEGTKL